MQCLPGRGRPLRHQAETRRGAVQLASGSYPTPLIRKSFRSQGSDCFQPSTRSSRIDDLRARMAQNWFQRQKSKLRERSHRSGSPHQTPAAPPAPATSPPPVTSSPPTTSPAPATPDAVSHTSSAPCQPTTTDIKKHLWNQAYDELKSTEVDLVEAYEKFLSAELQKDDSTLKLAALTTTIDNQISQDVQQRWRQMEQLVKVGLHRTEKSAATKQKINNEIQHILPVKELIGKAVQASPEAALAWVGISFSLEVSSVPE